MSDLGVDRFDLSVTRGSPAALGEDVTQWPSRSTITAVMGCLNFHQGLQCLVTQHHGRPQNDRAVSHPLPDVPSGVGTRKL
jgi:hypothetical protein